MSPERAPHDPLSLVSQLRNLPLEEVVVNEGLRGKSVGERGCY